MNHYVQFTELPRILFARGITKVTIVGLAMDWCVKASVRPSPRLPARSAR
jgi:nicotinamidase